MLQMQGSSLLTSFRNPSGSYTAAIWLYNIIIRHLAVFSPLKETPSRTQQARLGKGMHSTSASLSEQGVDSCCLPCQIAVNSALAMTHLGAWAGGSLLQIRPIKITKINFATFLPLSDSPFQEFRLLPEQIACSTARAQPCSDL